MLYDSPVVDKTKSRGGGGGGGGGSAIFGVSISVIFKILDMKEVN